MQIKKALIVYNKPLYQLLILEQKDAHYRRLFKQRHPATKNWTVAYDQHKETLEGVYRTLVLLGIPTTQVYRKDISKIARDQLVVTVGGDGTVLETSHFIDQQILLGVNGAPVESTGALCHTRLETFLTTMVDLMTGKLKPTRVPRLKVTIGKKVLPQPALNEVLFANRSPAGTSRYLIQIGKQIEEHKSSGVWVATGAGSTAAMRSAGGKVQKANVGGMQYWVREPLILPGNKLKILKGSLAPGKKISFTPTTRQSAVFIDGNHVEVPVDYGDKVTVSPNYKALKMIL